MAEEYTNDELAEWFKGKLNDLKIGSRARLLNAEERYTDDDSVFVGGVFFFKYDAKYKDNLPMWDKYPLCVPIDRFSDGFLGLNMHYLGKGQRQGIINSIRSMKEERKLSNTVKSKARNWQYMMNSGIPDGLYKKCVKRYLFGQVRTQFVRIQPDEYAKAIQLPLEEWVYKR